MAVSDQPEAAPSVLTALKPNASLHFLQSASTYESLDTERLPRLLLLDCFYQAITHTLTQLCGHVFAAEHHVMTLMAQNCCSADKLVHELAEPGSC